MSSEDAKHPTQPIIKCSVDGVGRFKANSIVRFLLATSPHDLNSISMLDFSREDRVQFAQLLGYSVCGFSDLSYVTDDDYERAVKNAPYEKVPSDG